MSNRDMWSRYGTWLLHRVGFNKTGYSMLMTELHNSPFIFFIERDNNRASDGLSLRDEFGESLGLRSIEFNQGCSVLEMLVAFAIRIEVEYIGDPKDEHPEKIFWEMVCNLGLDKSSNNKFDRDYIFLALKKWLERDFGKDGYGSIFPLKHPMMDQTQIEMWSQMNGYLMENYSI